MEGRDDGDGGAAGVRSRDRADSTVPPMPDPGTSFATSWAHLESVEGWLTHDQAERLDRAAREVEPPGRIVEIGSFRGRSAIILARAAAEGVEVVAIDPHAGTDRGPREIVTTEDHGHRDNDAFWANLRAAGVAERVRHVRAFSNEAHGEVADPIDVLFIDGAHRYAPAQDDISRWGARVRLDGLMLIHDSFNSVGVTGAQFRHLVFSGRWTYEGRSGSLTQYRRTPVTGAAHVRNSLRQLAALGYFAQSLAIKLALTARLRPIAKALGHKSDAPWPY